MELLIMNIEELQAALVAAKEQRKLEGNNAWQELVKRAKGCYVWQVKWLDKYTVNIHARFTDEMLSEMEALDRLYPESYSRIHDNQRLWCGMTYQLIGNVIVQSGGGWVVLEVDKTSAFRGWRELTDDQVAALRNGVVPDDLKSDNWK